MKHTPSSAEMVMCLYRWKLDQARTHSTTTTAVLAVCRLQPSTSKRDTGRAQRGLSLLLRFSFLQELIQTNHAAATADNIDSLTVDSLQQPGDPKPA